MPLVAAGDAGVPTRVLHSHCAFVEPNSTKAQLEEVIHKLNTYRTGIATEKFACSADAAAYFGFDRHGGEWCYVPNGIDVVRFSFDMGKRKDARAELGLLDSTFLIGNIGRFPPKKTKPFFYAHLLPSLSDARIPSFCLLASARLKGTSMPRPKGLA